MCATHLLIMLYLSVKFHQICFSSLRDIAETRFVTDGRMDGRVDFNMPPKYFSFGGIKCPCFFKFDIIVKSPMGHER